MNIIYIELFSILAIVLLLPFLIKKIEEEIEVFLFIMGIIAASISSQWNVYLVKEAFIEPIKITLAVLFAGLVFNLLQKPIADNINKITKIVGMKWFVFIVIVVLGFVSSIITAIIASLVLVEIISYLKLDRDSEIRIVVLTCFSIGLGAALTPIGEPLSTIVIAKLKGNPYQADFFFLARQIGYYLVPGIVTFGFIGMKLTNQHAGNRRRLHEDRKENIRDIFKRTGKVYLFVMALMFLGAGFKPLIDVFVSKLPYKGLYWINIISALLDNATLAAAEIGPGLSIIQIKAAILGLLISGGMLIPGNIPNIISANKLKIKSSEWARFAIPLGLIFMVVYFFILVLIPIQNVI